MCVFETLGPAERKKKQASTKRGVTRLQFKGAVPVRASRTRTTGNARFRR